MSNCPFCKQNIPSELLINGGYCPHCDELILIALDEDEAVYAPTERLLPEDLPTEEQVTEELEVTDAITSSVPNSLNLENKVEEVVISLPSLSNEPSAELDEPAPQSDLKQTSDPEEVLAPSDPQEVVVQEDDFGEDDFGEDDFGEDDFGMEMEEVEQFHRDVSGKKPLSPEMKKLLVLVFLCIAGVGVLFLQDSNQKKPETEVKVDMYVPEVTEHKGNEVEREVKKVARKKPKRATTSQRKSKPAKSKPKVVEIGGMELLQTNRPSQKSMLSAEIGAMSSDERIDLDINRLRKNLQYCHTRVLKKDPTVKGKWQISFTIKSSGDVKNVRIKPLRQKNVEIEECMNLRINKFGFSKPENAYPVKFSILFG